MLVVSVAGSISLELLWRRSDSECYVFLSCGDCPLQLYLNRLQVQLAIWS